MAEVVSYTLKVTQSHKFVDNCLIYTICKAPHAQPNLRLFHICRPLHYAHDIVALAEEGVPVVERILLRFR